MTRTVTFRRLTFQDLRTNPSANELVEQQHDRGMSRTRTDTVVEYLDYQIGSLKRAPIDSFLRSKIFEFSELRA